jgi:hypothetical protein
MSQIRRLAAILAAAPYAMSPPGVGWHSAAPLDSFGSVTCYLTNTQ